MASIHKRGDKWRAFVLVDGKRLSKTFRLKKEAIDWANEQEQEGLIERHTFKDLIEKYRPIAASHRGSQSELGKINQIERSVTFIDLPLEYVNRQMILGYRDARLQKVTASTVNREMSVLSTMFKLAVYELNWVRKNPMEGIKRPQLPAPRRRGISQTEIDDLVKALEARQYGKPVSQMFQLSIETGMRMGEMLNLTWDRVMDKFVILDITKNGDRRQVPLSLRAREIIKERRGIDDVKVFPMSPQFATTTFIRAKAKTPHKDVRFHDARSEAVTRLSKKLDVMQLAKIIGHRNPASLMFYYSESAESIADRL